MDDSVSVARTLQIFEGRWKVRIIQTLGPGPLRFGELRRQLAGVTAKVLTQQLRELERDGIVHRQQFRETPPRVEYSRTSLGDQLVPLLVSIKRWNDEYGSQIEQKRQAYDDARAAAESPAGLDLRSSNLPPTNGVSNANPPTPNPTVPHPPAPAAGMPSSAPGLDHIQPDALAEGNGKH